MTAKTNTNALNDTELQEVTAGGLGISASCVTNYVYDAKGRVVGYYKGGTLYYWKCSHCGNPIHHEGFYFCDPCDDWWFSRSEYVWTGTEAELIAAAN